MQRWHWVLLLALLLIIGAVAVPYLLGLAAKEKEEPGGPGYAGGNANDTGPRIAATCERTVASKADPIFKPTAEPPAHQHQFFGPPEVSNDTTRADLLGMSTTCKQPGDHSVQWRPEVYWHGIPLRHPPKDVIYYEITSPETAEQVRPWPADYQDVSRQPTFRCGNGEWSGTAPNRCSAGSIQIRMVYEQCLDPSSDVVEENTTAPVRGKCPGSHPLMIPKIQTTATYQLPEGQTAGPLTVAGNTGVMPASSMHEDYMNGWEAEALRAKVAKCLRQTNQNDPRPAECRTSDREQAGVLRRHKAH